MLTAALPGALPGHRPRFAGSPGALDTSDLSAPGGSGRHAHWAPAQQSPLLSSPGFSDVGLLCSLGTALSWVGEGGRSQREEGGGRCPRSWTREDAGPDLGAEPPTCSPSSGHMAGPQDKHRASCTCLPPPSISLEDLEKLLS